MHARARHTLCRRILAGTLLLLAGCGGGGGGGPVTQAPPNELPAVKIRAPDDGTTFQEGSVVVFRGDGADPEDGALFGAALSWSSSRDGMIANGEIVSVYDLTVGTHVITLRGVDSAGAEGTDVIGIEVTRSVGRAVHPGDLVITEIMPDPDQVPDEDGEWFEVLNPGPRPLNLLDLEFKDDDGDSFVVESRVVVNPGSFVVLGRSADTGRNGGVTVDYAYGPDFTLSNTMDEIVIFGDGGEIDRVSYTDTWPFGPGAAMGLDPASLSDVLNDVPESWCASAVSYGSGDLGTPREPNPACP